MMMKKSIAVCIGPLAWAISCGGAEEDTVSLDDGGGGASGAALVVEEIVFDLDSARLLSSLTDSEVASACDKMATALKAADEGVACQIVAASEATTEECEGVRDACLNDPEDALQQTTVRSAPAPIDCSVFEASLTAGCNHPVSLLEDCANALAQSVVPAAEATHCDKAAEIEDVEQAHELALNHLDTDYVSICIDLLECEALVGALLSGESPTGAGGASEE